MSHTGREKADNFMFCDVASRNLIRNFLINSDRFEIFLEKLRQSCTLHARKANTGVFSFLTSALDGGEWSTSDSDRFISGEESRYTWKRRLRGPQSHSERVGEKSLASTEI